ncbi:cathepsin L-like protein [Aphelenchoides avenae]|nr:cathepsin L-like protein [Aphelenchus avenae]
MVSTAVLLSVLASCAHLATTDETAFNEFLVKFKQTYKGAEYGRRLGIFTSNLKRIDELKKAGATGIGINVFAASTLEEMQRRVIPLDFEATRSKKNESIVPPLRRNKRQTIPSSFDYRVQKWVSPVRDQGQCGSCWAFATVALEECTHMRAYGFTHDLSEQILVDCTPAPNYGCGGGWVNVAFDYIRNNNGMTYESYYPYAATQTSCHTTPTQFADIAYYVYNYGAVAFYFQVPTAFYYYTGGIFDVPSCSGSGLHEMVIVGYAADYWIVKNSWGTGFGNGGFVYFRRGKNLCNMQAQLIGTYLG